MPEHTLEGGVRLIEGLRALGKALEPVCKREFELCWEV